MHVQQFVLQGLVQPLDLARGGRRPGPSPPGGDAVLPADPLEQHLGRAGLDEPAGEHGAVIGEYLLGHPVDGHRLHESPADRPGGGPPHRGGDDAVPGMVIDPGHDLHLGSVGEKSAGGHVQLPQLHRHRPFPPHVVLPPAAPRPRLDQLVADQHPVHRGPGHHAVAAAAHLEHQPFRTPLAMRPAQLAHRRLQLRRDLPRMGMDLMAAVFQARRPLVPVPAQPGMHALTAHPVPIGDLGHRNPGQHFQHGPVSLLGHAQLPQHERSVKHQAEPMCQASSGTDTASVNGAVTTFSTASRAHLRRARPDGQA